MKLSLCAILLIGSTSLYAQVGIGTTTPKAFFNVAEGKDVLFGQDLSGLGTKLIWYANKGAFRAGFVDGTQWNLAQIGYFSFATGLNTIANNYYSTAIGYANTASGLRSTALGIQAQASGANSMAIGFNTTAGGDNSTSMGNNVSTNGKTGAFIIGDLGGSIYSNTDGNQMMMRFGGGYMLYSNSSGIQAAAVGVQLAPNSNAWQTLSDSIRKENFRQANGASFLHKISTMRLGSWNYKGQDAKQYRHYGPMAQDFFAAFGHDALGTIGEDKSINQADFDGVNLIAIQALIQKVETLEAQLAAAQKKEKSAQTRLDQIEARLNDRPSPAATTFNP